MALAQPIGSLTQMATIRLGKRTDGRSPYIRDFVPLAGLDDLVFGGWDIFEDSAYDAAANAKVLEPALLEQVKEPMQAIKPMKAVFDPELRQAHHGPERQSKPPNNMDKARMLMDDIRTFQQHEQCRAHGHDLVRIHGSVPHGPSPATRTSKRSKKGSARTIPTSRRARSTLTPR